MNLLIKNIQTFLPTGDVKEKNILIENDVIKDVSDSVSADFKADKTIEGKNKFAVPGLINAHTHASMTLLRSYADDMSLMPWLNDKIWPVEAKMKREDIYWGAMLAAIEMIKSGTTAFADMYGPCMEEVAKAATETGLRAALSQGLIGVAPDADKKLESNIELHKNFNNAANGRITVMLGPHALYTCPPEYLKKVAEAANKLGAEIHIHMSETETEVNDCLKNYGKRPFAHVESSGLFENGTLAAHCVHLDYEDIEIIKKHNIRVAHNPGSNLKLASGVALANKLLTEGVTVALGTDGASSNNNLDMLEEMRLAALLAKVQANDPKAVPAVTALKMGTEYGAKALSLNNVGKIEKGYKADIVLYDTNGTNWHPSHNLVSLLIYSANSADTDTVIVDGNILMENKKLTTIDEEKVYFEVDKCVERLIG